MGWDGIEERGYDVVCLEVVIGVCESDGWLEGLIGVCGGFEEVSDVWYGMVFSDGGFFFFFIVIMLFL